jgi:hypothetical protein
MQDSAALSIIALEIILVMLQHLLITGLCET